MKKPSAALLISIGLASAGFGFAVDSPVVGAWRCTGSNGTLTINADGSGSFAYEGGYTSATCNGNIRGISYKAECPDWPLGYDGETGRKIDVSINNLTHLTGLTKAMNGSGSWPLNCTKKQK